MSAEHTRYLYGDSASLEVDYDILDMVTGLVDCILVVGTAYGDIVDARHQVESKQRRIEVLSGELGRFGDDARVHLKASAHESSAPEIGAFAESMVEHIESSIASWKEEQRLTMQQERRTLETLVEERHAEMREALERYLVERQFQRQSWAFETRLEREASAARLEWALPGDIRVAYELEQPPEWQAPFRLGELIESLELEVGFKKKLLRRLPVPYRVDFTDYYVIDLRCVPTGARLLLARKLGDTNEPVALELRIDPTGIEGIVHDAPGGFAPKAAAPEDLPQLRALWAALLHKIGDPGRYRHRVLGMWSSEGPVDDADTILAVVERFVAHARPIVRELALHSSNPAELSVKVDLGQGRREEIYIKRDALQRRLLCLPRPMMDRLAFPHLLPDGLLEQEDDPLVDMSDIVETDGGNSAVTVVSRLYPDTADWTQPGVGNAERAVSGSYSGHIEVSEPPETFDEDKTVVASAPKLRIKKPLTG